ncbi:VIER F-box protein 2 [Tanacetum coccineum]|uniref:VIER F-box protein 2 n=1 Tax=Tanacetum coccineum TaxID=301880 RepID=A0ABQ5C910_9ASTR
MHILSVVRIKAYSRYGYDYLKEITLRRADYQEYTIAEKDFKNLYPSDFEDLNLLLLQGHLNHLPSSDKCMLSTTLNLTKPGWDAKVYEYKHDYTIIESPRAVVFPVSNNERKIMRFNEIYKFSDGTLTNIMEAPDYRVKEYKVDPHKTDVNSQPKLWENAKAIFSTSFMANSFITGGIPLKFWSDCVFTAVYLIHMLPISVLKVTNSHLDVKFYETVFPFKMRNISDNEKAVADYESDADHLTFFDNQISQSPYDEGRATSVVEGSPSFSRTDNGHSHKVKYGLEKHVSYAKLNSVNFCFATTLNKSVEPSNYYDAASDPKWIEAMNKEIDALYRNFTWSIVDLPKGRKAIGCKWIYKIKYKASGEIERYKARLVAKGFSQKEGFDYDETFSPVVKMVTVRCVITIVVLNSWPLYRLDVNNDFLYGDLVEDVYMTFPLGFGDNNDNKHGFVQTKPAATPLPENAVLNSKENDCNNPYIQLRMTKVIKEEFEKIKDLNDEDVSLTCGTSIEVFNKEFNRMSEMDNDLFTYKVKVANIQCDSNKDDDSEQRVSHEADDDTGYDPSDVAFTKWLGSKKFNNKTMDHYTKKALWIYWIRGDDEFELTDEESSDNEDEVAEVFRIDTNIFDFETPMCKAFNEFNYLLQIDPDLLTKDIEGFKTYEEYKDDWIYEWNKDVPWVDEKPWTDIGDYEWYEALKDSELKEQALRNKAIMEGLISDDELCNDGWRRWESHEITFHDHDEIEYENETHDERQELCETHELQVCNMRRFEVIKYSFGQDEEHVVVKEDEYDDLARTNNDACRAY